MPVDSDLSEDDDVDKSDHYEDETWIENAIIQNQFPFVEEYGPHVNVHGCETSIDYFYLFLNDQLLDLIVVGTNRCEHQKMIKRTKTGLKMPLMNSGTL